MILFVLWVTLQTVSAAKDNQDFEKELIYENFTKENFGEIRLNILDKKFDRDFADFVSSDLTTQVNNSIATGMLYKSIKINYEVCYFS